MLGYPLGGYPLSAPFFLQAAPPVVTPPAPVDAIDAATVPASRRVVFGGGIRVVQFPGSIRTVRF